jgi:hypothetical protein
VRRAEWQWPEGLNVVGEYWLQTPDPIVVSIVEADQIAPMMAATADWDDVFSVRIVPAVSAEEGLRIASEGRSEG